MDSGKRVIPDAISKKTSSTLLEVYKRISDSQINTLQNLLETTSYFNNYSILLVKNFNPILDSMNALSKINKSLYSILKSYPEYINREIDNFSKILHSILDSPYMKSLFEKLEFSKSIKEAFHSASWPISSSIPKKIQERIIELHSSNRVRYASSVLIGYFKRNDYENLKNLLDRWSNNKFYFKRRKLLKEALDNHIRGNYHSSISVLLQCIEGVITDFIVENNIPSKINSPTEKSKSIVGKREDYNFSDYVVAVIFLDYAQGNLYCYRDFKDELQKTENKKTKNRHTIFHGITSDYGSFSSSLKHFICLDAIFDIIEANSSV